MLLHSHTVTRRSAREFALMRRGFEMTRTILCCLNDTNGEGGRPLLGELVTDYNIIWNEHSIMNNDQIIMQQISLGCCLALRADLAK